MKPLAHQEKFVSGYKDKDLIVHEGGTGKTICACLWLKDGRDSDALVICPQKVVKKWIKALEEWGTKATVISKGDFKKTAIKEWSAIVVDEADEFASPLFVASKRSALSVSLYNQVRTTPRTPILLLTATPIRSTPWNLHTLLCFLGRYIDKKIWQKEYFELKRLPYLPRPAYIEKKNWRIMIQKELEKHADIVNLRDITDLPPVTENTIQVLTPKFIQGIDDKPFFTEHRHEQINKGKSILEIGKEYRKIMVVAYYREQVEELRKELSKDRETFVIMGGVKDQEDVIEAAQNSPECYFIVQASIGAGFDADQFSCVVFASLSYAVRDFVQMKWRVRRVHNLHPIVYNYLIGGRCDKAVLRNIELGKDFIPSEYRTT